MKQHVISASVAAIVAAGAAFGTIKAIPPQRLIVAPSGTYSVKSESRRATTQWGELRQAEVDAITAALKMLPKRPVLIFCKNDERCGDMALDFDNAFESAHWDSVIDQPWSDDFVGIGASAPDIVAAINAATGGRFAVRDVVSQEPGKDILVIGRKPRG